MATIKLVMALVATATLAGCAATDATTVTERPSDREYRTGSRIPVRPGGPSVSDVRTIDRDSIERAGGADVAPNPTQGGGPGIPR